MINKPKGTYDILPGEVEKWQYIEARINEICQLFNYKEIRTPIFESSELFHRTVGETSDIVSKETYDFTDRGNRSNTLKPEGTAGVIRSVIENKLYANPQLPLKYYYITPLFRYERPQKGRQRQFHQFGVEAIGSDSHLLDVEVISFATTIIKAFGLEGIKVNINTLGDEESRNNYREALVNYFNNYKEELCDDCKVRLEKNPLRILDCKKDNKKEFFNEAPSSTNYLSNDAKNRFNNVLKCLDELEIKFEIDSSLVRGLDYYSHTVFEVEATIKDFGAQNVLCGGGRYNDLVKQLDGPDTSCVGFAFGIERLILALESENKLVLREQPTHVFVSSLVPEIEHLVSKIVYNCRLSGLITETDYLGKGLKNHFKQAERLNSKFMIIIGEDELENSKVQIKNLETGEQNLVDLDAITQYIISEITKGRHNHSHSCGGNCSCK